MADSEKPPVETSIVLADLATRAIAFSQAHGGLLRRDLEADVAERLHLLLDGGNDLRMLMTGIDHGNASAKVDMALTVFAPDLRVLGALGVDGGRMGVRAARPLSRRRRNLSGLIGVGHVT